MMRTTSDHENMIEIPLASKSQTRSDEPETIGFAPFKTRHEETSKAFVHVLALFVSVFAVLLVFALIFLRASAPAAELTSVSVSARTLKYTSYAVNTTSNATTSVPTLNVTLTAAIKVKNSNFGHFEYNNSTASVFFEGTEIGRGTVARGSVGGRGTARMNVTVEVRSGRQVENSTSFRSGIESGVLSLTSYGELRGRVHLINIIKKHKVSIVSCSMNLNLRNQTIEELVCN